MIDKGLGAQPVRWKGVQPGCGSIRRFLQDLNVTEGEHLFLEFRDDHTFDVVRAPTTSSDASPIVAALAMAMTGLAESEELSESARMASLAEAVEIPGEDRPRRILPAARGRDEGHLITLLERAWLVPNP